MKNIKKRSAVLAVAALLVLGSASACAHSHNNEEWRYNENQHWRVCSVDGEIDENSYGTHDFTGSSTCECGYNPLTYVPGSGGGNTGTGSGGNTGTGSGGGNGGNESSGGNGGSESGGNQGSGGNGGNEFTPPEGGEIENNPVAGAVKITKAEGDLEAAYVEWDKLSGAKWYNVYCKPENGSYQKLDAPLVREYKTNFRADAVGLKAGKYTLKVVPVDASGEKDNYSSTATVNVVKHAREGYAFDGGTASGAYNEDGTLKANAKVIYVTDATKDTVSVTLNTGKSEETLTGLQNILGVVKKISVPLDIRLIGQINSPAIDGDNNNKNENTVLIKGNKCVNAPVTFEGIGSDATAFGWTLRLVQVKNVEVRNIGFMNTQASEPDGITLEKDEYVWIHNCDLFYGGEGGANDQAKGDGALDTKESTNITHSYNHFWDSGKCNLQNMKETGDFKITYHHNWYDHSDSRHPRIRTATVHVYNNYFDGNAKYGVGVTMGASAFVENNYFRSTAIMRPMMSSEQGTDATGEGTFSSESGGMIKALGNFYDCSKSNLKLITQLTTTDKTNIDCYEASSRNEKVPAEYVTKKGGTKYSNFDTASDFYKYEVDTPEAAKTKVELYAGRIGGGDLKWDFNDSTEDSNYAVIAGLKSAIVNYKTSLVKVGS